MSAVAQNNPSPHPPGIEINRPPHSPEPGNDQHALPKEIIFSPDSGDGSMPIEGNELLVDDEVRTAFAQVDQEFQKNPESSIRKIGDSVRKIGERNGQDIEGALFYDKEDGKPDAIILNFPGMAAVKPKDADKLIDYLGHKETGGLKDKFKDFLAHENAGTNTWKQAVQSYSIQRFLKSMGLNVAVMSVFPPSQKAFTKQERKQIASGDFSAYDDIADSALRLIKDETDNSEGSGLQDNDNIPVITTGESIGANIAIAVQERLKNLGHNMNAVAVRELILGKGMGGLAVSYFFKQYAGQEKESPISKKDRIQQPKIKKEIDHKGNEAIGMSFRTIRAALRLSNMFGIANYQKTKELAHKLGDRLISGVGEHSRISEKTESHLSDQNNSVKFVAERGKVGHLSNEDVVLGALMSLIAIRKSGVRSRSQKDKDP